MYNYNKQNKPRAAKLRQTMTRHEFKLWYYCLAEFTPRFYRQRMIGNYIADFYCAKAKVAIELDGGQHTTPQAETYDKERTEFFNSKGIIVLRYFNNDIDSNFDAICQDIWQTIHSRISHKT